MQNTAELLKDKKILTKRLVPFGFVKEGTRYRYSKDIVGGSFRLEMTVSRGQKVSIKVFDNDSGEEYLLLSVLSVQGSLVGRIRKEVSEIVDKFAAECLKQESFKKKSTHDLACYAEQKYGDSPEYLWEKFPQFAAIRKHETKKWYCLLGTVNSKRIGAATEGVAEIANFKIEPSKIPVLLKQAGFYPAYHMNKKSWVTVLLDGTVPLDKIKQLLDESYRNAR